MRFTLSGRSPLNATYTDASSGEPTYKTHTPWSLGGVTTTASRVLPADITLSTGTGTHQSLQRRYSDSYSYSTANLDANTDAQKHSEDGSARFGHLASVRHRVGRSVITFGGTEISSREHFKKVGPLWRDKACIGPDGKGYKWIIHKYKGCELVRTNEAGADSDILVAKFTDRTLGIIGPAIPASLEIFPPGEEIMDYIFVTFLYVEKVRRDRKKG